MYQTVIIKKIEELLQKKGIKNKNEGKLEEYKK
jgi:hypothetical protein